MGEKFDEQLKLLLKPRLRVVGKPTETSGTGNPTGPTVSNQAPSFSRDEYSKAVFDNLRSQGLLKKS